MGTERRLPSVAPLRKTDTALADLCAPVVELIQELQARADRQAAGRLSRLMGQDDTDTCRAVATELTDQVDRFAEGTPDAAARLRRALIRLADDYALRAAIPYSPSEPYRIAVRRICAVLGIAAPV